jgi:phosphatidate phosphatase APP1
MRTAALLRGVAAGSAALLFAGAAAPARDAPEIQVHFAYGTPRSFTLEGRIAERQGGPAARGDDSRLRNLGRNVRSLRVEEQKRVPLRVRLADGTWEVRSDADGYFTLRGDTPPQAFPGWNPALVESADGTTRADTELLVVPPGDTLGIISDFDDTVIVSEVGDRSRLLGHSLLENYLQRRPIAGMADFYRGILARNPVPEAAPVIYLTASPRQLQPGIRAFLARNGFPRGPIVAKKVSDGAGGDPLLDQKGYKTARIRRILDDLPTVRFVLVGDDGEDDPEIYRTIRRDHPSRIEAVYIRRVNPKPGRRSYPDQLQPPVGVAAP